MRINIEAGYGRKPGIYTVKECQRYEEAKRLAWLPALRIEIIK